MFESGFDTVSIGFHMVLMGFNTGFDEVFIVGSRELAKQLGHSEPPDRGGPFGLFLMLFALGGCCAPDPQIRSGMGWGGRGGYFRLHASPRGPEIADLCGLNGPLPPQHPLEKLGGFATHPFQ